jgi:uncharacterized membrane protein YcaP (DUF421 family)
MIIQELWLGVDWALGLDEDRLTAWQMGLRALVIYIIGLAMVRIGGGWRLFGQHAAFDVVLGIIFGSILSRAVNGSAPFFETLGSGIVLIVIHSIFAAIAFRSHTFGNLVKGRTQIVVKDGEFQRDTMARNWISERDIQAAIRTKYKIDDIEQIAVARLERSGDISGIERTTAPKVIEVNVADGVQTVRIELG